MEKTIERGFFEENLGIAARRIALVVDRATLQHLNTPLALGVGLAEITGAITDIAVHKIRSGIISSMENVNSLWSWNQR